MGYYETPDKSICRACGNEFYVFALSSLEVSREAFCDECLDKLGEFIRSIKTDK